MIDFLKQHRNKCIQIAILAVFCVLAMIDFLNKNASLFIEDSFNFALTNIGIVVVLKIISGALPLTSGISEVLDTIFNFFFLANILIGLEYVLLMVNKILFVKLLIIAFFILQFIPQIRHIATKILIVLLFLNPGLNIYISAVKVISDEANMTINDDINAKMQSIKNMLGISQVPEIPDIELGDTRSGVSKFIGEIGMLGQSVNDGSKKVLDTITNPIDSTQQALDNAKAKILKSMQSIGNALHIVLNLMIKYMLNVFFLYFLMPIVYFYILYRVVSKRDIVVIKDKISSSVELKN